jgi:3-methyladenine DNA glycosylase AlkD
MQAYMKTTQPFHGVQTPLRRRLLREALKAHPITDFDAYVTIIRTLWNGPHREERYAALDIATDHKTHRTHHAWPLYVDLLRSADNWDTVDWIASVLLGEHYRTHRKAHEKEIKAWRRDPDLWVRRASLLVHLKHKDETDQTLLGETILLLAPETDFFIRKAIGWVLREQAKTDPEWVQRFVLEHQDELSSLSKREALKNL